MYFLYLGQLQAHFEPGDRVWATGFQVSDPPSKIVRNMPPTLVEFTCGGKAPEAEARLRDNGCKLNSVAPVRPDGTTDLKKTSSTADLHFFAEKPEAETAYLEQVRTARSAVQKALERLVGLNDRVAAIAAAAETDDT